jgi:hypothetical protein
MERETGLEPATPCLEGVASTEPSLSHLLNLKIELRPLLSVTNQVTPFFYLPPLA